MEHLTSVKYLGIEMDINGNAKQEYYKGEKKVPIFFILAILTEMTNSFVFGCITESIQVI
ncbi:hypothetical protein DERP_014118 [Dermatophagoides pteronyssinus]|uniref:Uncharacterized protein n=1 Tax=Dermatophagoides pteronyssinus TaxID=6956 RepID=A0ABQ8IXF9_DERPT|nr:hypothetical protein DERP_014118 [Dermatophagoides pteronyssinus]